MTVMLAPDLLDRRALALLALVDAAGRPVISPVRIEPGTVRTVRKGGGLLAILAAPGFAATEAAFDSPPATTPATLALDLTPADRRLAPRRLALALPRDADPARAAEAGSLFRAHEVPLYPSPLAGVRGSDCRLAVTVRRQSDGALVENALVRAASDDGRLSAMAMTDAGGEAALLFPELPLAWPGPGATLVRGLAGRAIVDVVPESARFHAPDTLARARRAALARTTGHADPDAIAASRPADFAAGAAFTIAAGGRPAITIEWNAS